MSEAQVSRGSLVKMTYKHVGRSEWGNGASEWRVQLTGEGGKRTFTFNTGSAISSPDVDDVVHNILSESMDYDSHSDWLDYVTNFESEPDPYTDEGEEWAKEWKKTWRLMGENADRLEHVLGTREFFDLYEEHYDQY